LPIGKSKIKYSDDGDRKDPAFAVDFCITFEKTDPKKERFDKALKTLHLQPMVHEIQKQGHSRGGRQTMGT
jgi:hypothetical protein